MVRPTNLNRRDLLVSAVATGTTLALPSFAIAQTADAGREFSFDVVTVAPADVLTRWQELRGPGIVPIIVGSDENLAQLRMPFDEPDFNSGLTPTDILKTAAGIEHPAGLKANITEESAFLCEAAKKNVKQIDEILTDPKLDEEQRALRMRNREIFVRIAQSCDEAPVVDLPESWPSEEFTADPLDDVIPVLFEPGTNSVHIVNIPTNDWTTLPAHLHWGGWNAHPQSEFHVAAWRSWRDRYGAEPVGMSGDTLIMRVTKKPADRKEAYQLAQEQYLYCNDIVDQGLGSVKALAGWLMVSDFWYFWWD